MSRLHFIKLIHTAIWVFFNLVIFYLYYAVITIHIDKWVWICIGLILLEGLVLLIFKGICPLTLVAGKYTEAKKDNFDIFLPEWLAKYNKLIYASLFIVALLILIYRLMNK